MSKQARRQLPNRTARRNDTLAALAVAAASCADGNQSSFPNLTVDRLARRAGISRASFYIYFEDKAELVRAWNRDLDERVNTVLAQWWPATPPTPYALRRMLDQLTDIYRGNRVVLTAIHEMTAHDPLLRQARADSSAIICGALRQHIVRGQQEGWVSDSLQPATTAAWIVSMLERVLQQVVPARQNAMSLLDTGADVIWRTLYQL
ncbi:TetR/AcrR family transcriptional regulator [Mycobacteroides franklinii]|uniref:TetR/AcrR family transcriptional regulator n=1 Tax=Mycobacteroides franklinii TaxID=948102 RepID=UPI001F3FE694|nr:TetR/AcrR family transcriptional regulator [Mycobacteroides franklinii]